MCGTPTKNFFFNIYFKVFYIVHVCSFYGIKTEVVFHKLLQGSFMFGIQGNCFQAFYVIFVVGNTKACFSFLFVNLFQLCHI